MQIVEAVIIRPLLAERAEVRSKIAAEIAKANEVRNSRPEKQAHARKLHAVARREEERSWREAKRLYASFIERLRGIRVLDPACGSGNTSGNDLWLNWSFQIWPGVIPFGLAMIRGDFDA
jgi:hypothetical protein